MSQNRLDLRSISEPTAEQCNQHTLVLDSPAHLGYAIWYPQMGGYCGKAIVILDRHWTENSSGARTGGCFEVLVWHDGDMPFSSEDGALPSVIHHCDPEQFIEFGTTVRDLNLRGRIEED